MPGSCSEIIAFAKTDLPGCRPEAKQETRDLLGGPVPAKHPNILEGTWASRHRFPSCSAMLLEQVHWPLGLPSYS